MVAAARDHVRDPLWLGLDDFRGGAGRAVEFGFAPVRRPARISVLDRRIFRQLDHLARADVSPRSRRPRRRVELKNREKPGLPKKWGRSPLSQAATIGCGARFPGARTEVTVPSSSSPIILKAS